MTNIYFFDSSFYFITHYIHHHDKRPAAVEIELPNNTAKDNMEPMAPGTLFSGWPE
jgi:hypothetical protein